MSTSTTPDEHNELYQMDKPVDTLDDLFELMRKMDADPRCFQSIVGKVATDSEITTEDLCKEMTRLVEESGNDAPFAFDHEGKNPTTQAAGRLLFMLDKINMRFCPQQQNAVALNSILSVSLPRRSLTDVQLSLFVEARREIAKKRVMSAPRLTYAANGAPMALNIMPQTSHEFPFPTGANESPLVLAVPFVTLFATAPLPNGNYSVIRSAFVLVVPGPESVLDREGVPDFFDTNQEVPDLLNCCAAPAREETDSVRETPNRHPPAFFGQGKVLPVDETFTNFEDDSTYLVKLEAPVVMVGDDFTCATLQVANGHFVPVICTWAFRRYQIARDLAKERKERIDNDQRRRSLSEREILSDLFGARVFLAPFAIMWRQFDAATSTEDAAKKLRTSLSVERELMESSEPVFTKETADALFKQREHSSFFKLACIQDKRYFEHAHANPESTPKTDPGHFCAFARWTLFAHLEESGKLDSVSDEDFPARVIELERDFEQRRKQDEALVSIIGEVAKLAPVLEAVFEAEIKYNHKQASLEEANSISGQELLQERLLNSSVKINLHTGKAVNLRDVMALHLSEDTVLNLDDDKREESNDKAGDDDDDDDDEKCTVSEMVDFCKKSGITKELLLAVLSDDPLAVQKFVKDNVDKARNGELMEQATAGMLSIRRSNQEIATCALQFEEFLANRSLTDMRGASKDPVVALRAMDVFAFSGSLTATIVLNSANMVATLLQKPIQPLDTPSFASLGCVFDQQLCPASVGVSLVKVMPHDPNIKTTTWPLYGLRPDESAMAVIGDSETEIAKIPGISHAQLGLQVCLLAMAATRAAANIPDTRALKASWISFVVGGVEYETHPFLLHPEPLLPLSEIDGTPVFRLRDPCPFISDTITIPHASEKQPFFDGSVIYLVRLQSDPTVCVLLNSASGTNALFGHFFGGRFFNTGYGEDVDAREWNGLRSSIFAGVPEETASMFEVLDVDGETRYSNPFRLEIQVLLQLFGWTSGALSVLEE